MFCRQHQFFKLLFNYLMSIKLNITIIKCIKMSFNQYITIKSLKYDQIQVANLIISKYEKLIFSFKYNISFLNFVFQTANYKIFMPVTINISLYAYFMSFGLIY